MATATTLSPYVSTPALTQKTQGVLGIVHFNMINGKMAVTSNEGRTIYAWMTVPAKFGTDMNGLFPFVIQDLFLDMIEEISKVDDRNYIKNFKATVFAQLSPTASHEYIAEMIRTKQLAYIHFEKGAVKAVEIHADWNAKMEEENAADEMVIDSGHAKYLLVKETYNMYSLDDSAYKRRFNIESF